MTAIKNLAEGLGHTDTHSVLLCSASFEYDCLQLPLHQWVSTSQCPLNISNFPICLYFSSCQPYFSFRPSSNVNSFISLRLLFHLGEHFVFFKQVYTGAFKLYSSSTLQKFYTTLENLWNSNFATGPGAWEMTSQA